MGRPLTIVQTGQMDLPDVHKRFTDEELLLSFHYHFEMQKKITYENLDKKGYEYLDGVTLLDMEGMTLFSHTYPPAMKFFEKVYYEYEHYFTGYISQVYLLNCPWIFKFLWNIISKMLSEVNKKKVVIINNYDELYNYFDKESLPVKYGGSCDSCEGGCIPVKLTDLNSKRTNKSFRKTLNSYHIVLKARESKIYNLNVKKGDTVNYTISTDSYDIKFGINLKYIDENNNTVERSILNENKVECDKQPLCGSIIIRNDGECLAILDNSYARWHSKTIDFEYYISNAQD